MTIIAAQGFRVVGAEAFKGFGVSGLGDFCCVLSYERGGVAVVSRDRGGVVKWSWVRGLLEAPRLRREEGTVLAEAERSISKPLHVEDQGSSWSHVRSKSASDFTTGSDRACHVSTVK